MSAHENASRQLQGAQSTANLSQHFPYNFCNTLKSSRGFWAANTNIYHPMNWKTHPYWFHAEDSAQSVQLSNFQIEKKAGSAGFEAQDRNLCYCIVTRYFFSTGKRLWFYASPWDCLKITRSSAFSTQIHYSILFLYKQQFPTITKWAYNESHIHPTPTVPLLYTEWIQNGKELSLWSQLIF